MYFLVLRNIWKNKEMKCSWSQVAVRETVALIRDPPAATVLKRSVITPEHHNCSVKKKEREKNSQNLFVIIKNKLIIRKSYIIFRAP